MQQFLILKDFYNLSLPATPTSFIRNFKNFDNDTFNADLLEIDWNNLIFNSGNDVNKIFDNFYHEVTRLLNTHAPLRKQTKKETSLKSKPWINKEIQNLMWKRDKLFRKYCKEKDLSLKQSIHNQFKSLRNQVSFMIKKAKHDYFDTYLEKNKNNISNTWKGITNLVTLKAKGKFEPKILSINNKCKIDPRTVANAFNNCFIKIGPNALVVFLG